MAETKTGIENSAIVPKPRRLGSIDALRGFDMFWITGGTEFWLALVRLLNQPAGDFLAVQFSHAPWSGFTFYDLIFPLFVFLSGVSIPFSITKRLERGDDRRKLYKHIFIRTLILFVVGVLDNDLNRIIALDFANVRIMGVLQRIAICYFFTGIVAMNLKVKNQAIVTAIILLGYWGIIMLVPVPGVGAGVLTPEGNLASYIDRLILPGRYCCNPYGDAEGLLSTIPAVATCLLGALSGHWLRSPREPKQKIRGFFGAGALCLGLGLVWNLAFPIIKYLWTSSYVLFACGWSVWLLCLFYWVIDVRGHTKWAFYFTVIGLNAILIYLLGQNIDFGFIADVTSWPGTFQPLLIATLHLAGQWIILYLLYRKKWFLKI